MMQQLRNLLDTLLIGDKISLWQLVDVIVLLANVAIGVAVGVIIWKILRGK
jgi:hypothetical protein